MTINVEEEKEKLVQDYMRAERQLVTHYHTIKTTRSLKKRWLVRLNNFHNDHKDKFTLDEYKFIFKTYQTDIWPKDINIRMQGKYAIRALNVYREMLRINMLFPEIKDKNNNVTILDLSSGGCGLHEAAGYYGNKVTSTEYFGNIPEFEGIHNELGIKPIQFDGTVIPLEFKDKSFDYVFSGQAINLYCIPRRYPIWVNEFLRIGRKKLVLIYNNLFFYDHETNESKTSRGAQSVLAAHPNVIKLEDPDRGLLAHIFEIDQKKDTPVEKSKPKKIAEKK